MAANIALRHVYNSDDRIQTLINDQTLIFFVITDTGVYILLSNHSTPTTAQTMKKFSVAGEFFFLEL